MKKILKYMGAFVFASSMVGCSDWTDVEREIYPNQENLEKYITLLDAQSEEDLTPTMRKHFAEIREYRKTPHVKGFGWFGNWTGKGSNAQNYLKMLPDSVDFVSLWGARGHLSEEQKADLKFFQEVKGGKALLCWIIQDVGNGITPHGLDPLTYWKEKGGGTFEGGVIAYANAICDTIEKYNLDGFDIDYEPGYGASGNLANGQWIEENGNKNMYIFIKTLSERLRPAGRMLVMDGQPDLLTTETSKMVDHYIYQAYWENNAGSVIYKIKNTHLTDWERKTIITAEFEQGWREGGISWYSSARPEIQKLPGGRQLTDYATLDLPSGKRIGGIGTYHMEYDFANNPPYRWLRQALYFGNQVIPGKFQ